MAKAGEATVEVTLEPKVSRAIIERLDCIQETLTALTYQCMINTDGITLLLTPEQIEAVVDSHESRQKERKGMSPDEWKRLTAKFLKHTETTEASDET